MPAAHPRAYRAQYPKANDYRKARMKIDPEYAERVREMRRKSMRKYRAKLRAQKQKEE